MHSQERRTIARSKFTVTESSLHPNYPTKTLPERRLQYIVTGLSAPSPIKSGVHLKDKVANRGSRCCLGAPARRYGDVQNE